MKELRYSYPKLSFRIFRGVLLCILVSLSLSSCDAIGELIDGLPTATFVPTPIYCPDIDEGQINTSALDLQPKLIVILLESSPNQRDVIDKAIEVIREVIPAFIEPGDQVVVFKMGYRDYRDSLLVDVEPPIATRPAIAATPTSPATLQADVEITPVGVTQLEKNSERLNATATFEAAAATATLEWTYYECAMNDWAGEFSAVATAWESTKQDIVVDVSSEIKGILVPGLVGGTAVPTADDLSLPTGPLANSVYESLVHVSSVFTGVGCDGEFEKGGAVKRCFLVIFDDLREWRRDAVETGSLVPANSWDINLADVEVLSVMLNCSRIYEPNCIDWQEFWTTQFRDEFHASSVEYLDGHSIQENLGEFFNR